MDMVARAAERIDFADDGCWLWAGSVATNGYALLPVKVAGKWTTRVVHRLLYGLLVEPVPEDHQLDHLCRVRTCVNPDHLEPVTHVENIRRGLHGVLRTRCRHGHEMTPENTYHPRKRPGERACLACLNASSKAAKAKRKQKG